MSIRARASFSLADRLFNRDSVGDLAAALDAAVAGFDRETFEQRVLAGFPGLPLKQRIDWMVTVLAESLPEDFEQACGLLLRALPPPLDPELEDNDFGEFIWAVPAEFVARHGCRPERLETSLGFLREATRRFSAESAIRPFLRDYPAQTLAFLEACAVDRNYHLRRLASEGSRPLLPWAIRVNLPVERVIGLLDALHADSTRYVTRSVANNLNDISRSDPDLVLRTLRHWRKMKRQGQAELDWMTRHALRTLVKRDHAGALAMLGYASKPALTISATRVSRRVPLGGYFYWRCRLTSERAQRLKILLRVHFLRANGNHGVKVFAVSDVRVARGEVVDIDKRLPFRPVTTRTLYPGTHFAELVINGNASEKRAFQLTA